MSAPLGKAAAVLLLSLAEAFAPAPDTKISDWAATGALYLGERTNTPRPGPFSFEGTEYLVEPVDRLHPDDPAPRVPILGGAQSAKSMVPQIWMGWSIAVSPRSFAVGLPSDGEVGKYNDYKLQPIIEDSEQLKHKVRPVSTKASEGSTARKKKLYTGHSILVFNLNSPKELQMISTGNLVLEETANTQADVGERGDPITQARHRAAAYSVIGSKECMVSTPGIQGECQITKAYEAGDQRRFYGQCQHCGGYFWLKPEAFKTATAGMPNHFECHNEGCGMLHEEKHNAAWRKAGIWIPCFRSDDESNPQPPDFIPASEIARWAARNVEGRYPSYYVWQAMCGLISWDFIADAIKAAKTPSELKTLSQQTFGRAWDPSVETLAWEELHKLCESYEPQIVPNGAYILTGFSDVQGAFLQWGVLAWGPGAEWWIVDRGVITSEKGGADADTAGDEVWRQLDEVVRKRYPHVDGGDLPIAAFGVDTGFRTHKVYDWVRGRHNCYALDGRPDWHTPIMGKPKAVKIVKDGRVVGRVKLWPTGTWSLKSLLAWSLKQSIESGYNARQQGRGHWSKQEDEGWCREMTAEVLCEEKNKKTGAMDRWWKKIRKNEDLDIWAGARALAWMLGVGAPPRKGGPGEAIDWQAEIAKRGASQSELFAASAPAGVPDEQVPAQQGDKDKLPWWQRKR